MNEYFHLAGLGRPIVENLGAGQVQVQALVIRDDGNEDVVGGAVAARWDALDAVSAAVETSGRVHVLLVIYVDPRLQRRGYGRALLKAVKTKAKRLGAQYPVAQLPAHDPTAVIWFERAGFTIGGRAAQVAFDGVVAPTKPGTVLAWIALTEQPKVTVTTGGGDEAR